MGSISSRPKTPQQQVVYVPSTPATPIIPSVDTGGDTPPVTVDAQQSEARRQNLLERNRGRLGTILSGFRGVLSSSNTSSRKTLLGE